MKEISLNRPPFDEAVAEWQSRLSKIGLPKEVTWIYEENRCFEPDASKAGSFRLAFQTGLTPPPPNAAEITYAHFLEFKQPIVFYRAGTSLGKSVCLLLCDSWFANKTELDGYERRSDWGISFYLGQGGELEHVTDVLRWRTRVLKGRPLDAIDFCMPLRAVHEILAHGRVLTSYEHYALKFVHSWAQFITEPRVPRS